MLLLVLPSRFLLDSTLSFRLSGDLERDLEDLESLESDLDFLDLLRSSLLDRDFFEREHERDLGDLDLLRIDFIRSCERDLDLLDFERLFLDLDLECERLDFEAGDRDRRVLESRLAGDLVLDFFERFAGDFDLDRDFFADLSADSGDGVRLFFFLPSAMLISFACSLDIATAASLQVHIISLFSFRAIICIYVHSILCTILLYLRLRLNWH